MTPDLPSVTLVALILAFCRLVSEQGLADLLRDVSKLDVKEIWYQGEAKAHDQYGVDEKVHARCHVSLGRHLIVIFACEALNRFLRYISLRHVQELIAARSFKSWCAVAAKSIAAQLRRYQYMDAFYYSRAGQILDALRHTNS